jgi:hypothetical protein
MRRFSLGEIYHRLRRTSLRIRSCMTDFLKRLSRASCDSPSLSVTDANTFTSFPSSNLNQLTIYIYSGHKKTGLLAHNTLGGNRACMTLAVDLSPFFALKTLMLGVFTANGTAIRTHSLGSHGVGLLNLGHKKPLVAYQSASAVHPYADNKTIIPDYSQSVKASTRFCMAMDSPSR